MEEDGKNTDSGFVDGDRVKLGGELKRLRKAGLSDLATRPHRYPMLTTLIAATTDHPPTDALGRARLNQDVFGAAIERLSSVGLRRAAEVLFDVGGHGPIGLEDRRRLADRHYTGRAYAREPDTIQRQLERQVLDPLLIDALLELSALPTTPASHPPPAAVLDVDGWADDVERAMVCLYRQDFTTTRVLLDRWLRACDPARLGEDGLYLLARSYALRGEMRQYQGQLHGPLSAEAAYRDARALFTQLGQARRVAQVELQQAVINEMSGSLLDSAALYRGLATDERLRPYERARARLWIGTALTKAGQVSAAVTEIEAASREFETLDEPNEWGIAHQKRALAHLAAGEQAAAGRSIELALPFRDDASPLEQIRLATAHGHVLVTDPRTAGEGLAVLDRARDKAVRHGLGHQLTWIERIRKLPEQSKRRSS